ncbi:ferredoxin [Clostridium lacusfryxellense]|uniref:ferredoxin n=1 Tax=Clostridium lacusfryxellense TaxID=205328 RepID=UPI001C0AB426|nr:ferredoxin [Clostridium lacusfryxellense]MBU3113709.1 ferredoxin [Clostridium lacusfryxellense]
MKAYVDKDTCIGCGLCPGICPEIFQMEDDGKAVASLDEVPENLVSSAKEAEEQCPVAAIIVE